MESKKIDQNFLDKIKALNLPEKKENNPYFLLHVYGDNIRVPETFNVKVYTGKKGLKLVTNDYVTLMNLIENRIILEKDYKREDKRDFLKQKNDNFSCLLHMRSYTYKDRGDIILRFLQ